MSGPLLSVVEGIGAGNWAIVLAGLVTLVVLLGVAFPVHELAHALAAQRLGDDTAERQGRITLNPLAHLDPIGALFVAILGFGWAKPVPVLPYYLRPDPRTGMALVSLAGPASNVALAVLFAIPARLLDAAGAPAEGFGLFAHLVLLNVCQQSVYLNLILALFNLIPIPPLDGSRVLAVLWPEGAETVLAQLQQYGFIIILLLSVSGLLSLLIVRPAMFLFRLLVG
ncbi:MAG: site-2 protease family protein [Anaerolineae bacterium]|nr:site-2 protease family protein [Thermoflexales bacterium]MDW8395492.1 site-2 protease family protein [Anaerolineae bacterium]